MSILESFPQSTLGNSYPSTDLVLLWSLAALLCRVRTLKLPLLDRSPRQDHSLSFPFMFWILAAVSPPFPSSCLWTHPLLPRVHSSQLFLVSSTRGSLGQAPIIKMTLRYLLSVRLTYHCARPCSKYFLHLQLQQAHELGTSMSVFQKRRLRLRKVNQLALDHTTSEWWV